MKRLQNKVAIVTGGAVGIGRTTCLILAKSGAKVAVTDLQDEDGRKVVAEIKKQQHEQRKNKTDEQRYISRKIQSPARRMECGVGRPGSKIPWSFGRYEKEAASFREKLQNVRDKASEVNAPTLHHSTFSTRSAGISPVGIGVSGSLKLGEPS